MPERKITILEGETPMTSIEVLEHLTMKYNTRSYDDKTSVNISMTQLWNLIVDARRLHKIYKGE